MSTRLLWSSVLLFWLSVSAVSCSPRQNPAGNLLRSPESVVYDATGHRYFVSNKGNGAIIAIDEQGKMTTWKQDSKSIRGLVLLDGVLYAAADEGVLGWNLTTGQRVLTAHHNKMSFLNDLVADGQGNLYASDSNCDRIFKVNLKTGKVAVAVEHGLRAPNGMVLDALHHRLLVVSFCGHSPVQAIDLATDALSTVAETHLDQLDGLALDANGNLYCSSWATGTIYCLSGGDFGALPTKIVGGLTSPADFLLRGDGSFAVPEMNANRLKQIPAPASGN